MNTVTMLKNDLETWAKRAPEYDRNSRTAALVTVLANKYCEAFDAGDEYAKNVYFGALTLKFWDQVNKIYNKIKTANKDYDDAAMVLIQSIMTACDPVNRAWQKNSKLNAQACIQQVIATRGIAQVMYESNLKKNLVNVNQISLDHVLDDDSGLTIADTLADTSATPDVYDREEQYLVQKSLDDNHVVEAIIMETIATRDVFKHEKHTCKAIDELTGEEYKYTEVKSTFWPYKLVQELNDLGEDYVEHFLSTYEISAEKFHAAFSTLSKANNQKKYKYISQMQAYGRQLANAE